MTRHVYRFKVTLQGISPPIWRRIEVPESYTFWGLHVAIQDAMGWEDYHLHQFEVRDPRTGNKVNIGIPSNGYDFDAYDMDELPGWEERIANYFTMANRNARYEYDFGDGWIHKVTLEQIHPVKPGVRYPVCLTGKRACPPEDVGGIWGYQNMLETLKDPKHDEYEETLQWLGGSYDPESFDPAKVAFDDPEERFAVAFGEE